MNSSIGIFLIFLYSQIQTGNREFACCADYILYLPSPRNPYLSELGWNNTSIGVAKFSRKVSQPEEGKNHSSAKLAVILSDCTEIATGDAASLRYGI